MHRLLAALLPAPCTGCPPGPSAAAGRPDAPQPAPAQPEPPGACGWFDSSHALQQGLCVTEHASADAVSADLPLADWLQWHLGGWSPPRAGEPPH